MKRQGFTLVEVIIYVGIFATMIVFVAGVVARVGASAASHRNRAAVENEADFVMSRIKWAMTGATAIGQPATGASSTLLSITRYGFASNPVVISLTSGTVFMSRGGGAAVPISSSNVRIGSLSFTHNPEAVEEPESLTVTLNVAASSSDPSVLASTSLKSTIYLRK